MTLFSLPIKAAIVVLENPAAVKQALAVIAEEQAYLAEQEKDTEESAKPESASDRSERD